MSKKEALSETCEVREEPKNLEECECTTETDGDQCEESQSKEEGNGGGDHPHDCVICRIDSYKARRLIHDIESSKGDRLLKVALKLLILEREVKNGKFCHCHDESCQRKTALQRCLNQIRASLKKQQNNTSLERLNIALGYIEYEVFEEFTCPQNQSECGGGDEEKYLQYDHGPESTGDSGDPPRNEEEDQKLLQQYLGEPSEYAVTGCPVTPNSVYEASCNSFTTDMCISHPGLRRESFYPTILKSVPPPRALLSTTTIGGPPSAKSEKKVHFAFHLSSGDTAAASSHRLEETYSFLVSQTRIMDDRYKPKIRPKKLPKPHSRPSRKDEAEKRQLNKLKRLTEKDRGDATLKPSSRPSKSFTSAGTQTEVKPVKALTSHRGPCIIRPATKTIEIKGSPTEDFSEDSLKANNGKKSKAVTAVTYNQNNLSPE